LTAAALGSGVPPMFDLMFSGAIANI